MKLKKSLKNAKIYKCEKMNYKMTQKFGEKKNKKCEKMEERKGRKGKERRKGRKK